MSDEENYVLSVEHMGKTFPGVQALSDVQFSLKKGEVHCLLGENGAGKSTFIKILGGIYKPDGGIIRINGKQVEISSVSDARRLGISIIHQELCMAQNLTVADNIFLGREPVKALTRFVDAEKMKRDAAEIFDTLGIQNIEAASPVYTLKTSKQQMVEIAKALSMDAKIIIMDEPTSSLTENEVNHLFEFMKNLKSRGIPIIYISHRLEEVFEVGDRVTVFRDGKYITTRKVQETDRGELITLMAGRKVTEYYHSEEKEISNNIILEVKHFTRKNIFKDVSFKLHQGEIVGFFGLVGAGRTELSRAIFGIDKPDSGELYIGGKRASIKNPMKAIEYGLALVPENRKEQGLILINTIKFNLTLTVLKEYIKYLSINRSTENSIVNYYMEKLKIKAPDISALCVNMSGGNQQKVVLGKWLATKPKILILDEPTRGIDVGTKAELYRIIRSLADEGITVMLISSELPEIVNLSDRVIVMYEGALAAELTGREEITQLNIMRYAVGGET